MSRNALISGVMIAISALVAGCASTSSSGEHDPGYDFTQIERTAVIAVEGAGGSEAAQNQVAAMFNEVLLRKGYSPVERAQVREIIDEQNFSNSQATSNQGAAELGRILNVDAVVTANVPEYGETMSISAQMMDVETAAILWTASGSGSTGSDLSEDVGGFFGATGGAAAGAEADGTVGALVGAAAGGVGGSLAGRAMTPEQQEQAAVLINEMSETLPDGY